MTEDSAFTIECTTDGVLRATCTGELDLVGEPLLVQKVNESLCDNEVCAVVVDVTAVSFMDSSGLRALLACRDQAAHRAVPFTVAVCPGPVTRLFEVAGVTDWFTYE